MATVDLRRRGFRFYWLRHHWRTRPRAHALGAAQLRQMTWPHRRTRSAMTFREAAEKAISSARYVPLPRRLVSGSLITAMETTVDVSANGECAARADLADQPTARRIRRICCPVARRLYWLLCGPWRRLRSMTSGSDHRAPNVK